MLQKYNFYRVLSWFLENPTRETGWRELSGRLKLGPPSTRRYIGELESAGVIARRRFGKRTLYRANRESRKFRLFMAFGTAMKLEDTGLVDFLNKTYGYPPVILFGSCSTGEATEGSDIDIAVITESKKEVDLSDYGKRIGKEIQLFKFKRKEILAMKSRNPSLFNGLFNGLVLSGRIDV